MHLCAEIAIAGIPRGCSLFRVHIPAIQGNSRISRQCHHRIHRIAHIHRARALHRRITAAVNGGVVHKIRIGLVHVHRRKTIIDHHNEIITGIRGCCARLPIHRPAFHDQGVGSKQRNGGSCCIHHLYGAVHGSGCVPIVIHRRIRDRIAAKRIGIYHRRIAVNQYRRVTRIRRCRPGVHIHRSAFHGLRIRTAQRNHGRHRILYDNRPRHRRGHIAGGILGGIGHRILPGHISTNDIAGVAVYRDGRVARIQRHRPGIRIGASTLHRVRIAAIQRNHRRCRVLHRHRTRHTRRLLARIVRNIIRDRILARSGSIHGARLYNYIGQIIPAVIFRCCPGIRERRPAFPRHAGIPQ